MKRHYHFNSSGHYIGYDFEPVDDRYNILGLAYNPNPRDKWSHPYSYDPIIIWYGNAQKGDHAVYSDRLAQWDYTKYQESAKVVQEKHPAKTFKFDNHSQVEEFLSLYFGKPIHLTAIVEGCNVSNGYPYWVFYYRDK